MSSLHFECIHYLLHKYCHHLPLQLARSGRCAAVQLSASMFREPLCLQMMFAVLAAVGVFLLVPRGISVGEVELQSDHMSWNTTKGTYQLKLLAKIPVYNPNYMKVNICMVCTSLP